MLGAIRRTGCSFVFRFVFKPPPPSYLCDGGMGVGGRERGGLDKRAWFRQLLSIRGWKSIQPTPAAFSVEAGVVRTESSTTPFLSFHPAVSPFPPLLLHPRASCFSRTAYRRRASSLVLPFLEPESSIALDSIVPLLSRGNERGGGWEAAFYIKYNWPSEAPLHLFESLKF